MLEEYLGKEEDMSFEELEGVCEKDRERLTAEQARLDNLRGLSRAIYQIYRKIFPVLTKKERRIYIHFTPVIEGKRSRIKRVYIGDIINDRPY